MTYLGLCDAGHVVFDWRLNNRRFYVYFALKVTDGKNIVRGKITKKPPFMVEVFALLPVVFMSILGV
ncbi:hypothetical protein FCL40_11255 [Ferrimonas sediminicola]|uniref:Uncharacterized protein n=1 Tax=Ferrimonas sediminicola TaxID=2569538 RepID=A0A4U1BDA7_9GAMM|nr:hypothetical protein [Ferrimonas sediminicola]TKB48722.1 hypothetical protein FCL40_11255 [Ferrimonas sediminicola]